MVHAEKPWPRDSFCLGHWLLHSLAQVGCCNCWLKLIPSTDCSMLNAVRVKLARPMVFVYPNEFCDQSWNGHEDAQVESLGRSKLSLRKCEVQTLHLLFKRMRCLKRMRPWAWGSAGQTFLRRKGFWMCSSSWQLESDADRHSLWCQHFGSGNCWSKTSDGSASGWQAGSLN